jgi:hypothetical protein
MAQYSVQPGDNPSKIAKKFGMTLAQFQKINPDLVEWGTGNWKVLFPGQIVNVNGVVTGAPPETAAAAPTSFAAPPPWMQIAIMEQGVQEWAQGDNPRILEYLKSCGISGNLLKDETAWCAAFVNWCIKRAGYSPQGSAKVSDWWGWGRPVAATYGAICHHSSHSRWIRPAAATSAFSMRWMPRTCGCSAVTRRTKCASLLIRKTSSSTTRRIAGRFKLSRSDLSHSR